MNDPVDAQTFWTVIGFVVAGIAGGYGLWFLHIRTCNVRERKDGQLEEKITHMEAEIGNHETGIIGQLHRYSKVITRILAKLGMSEK